MNKTLLNFAAALVLTFSAFAVENIFSISTNNTNFYEDSGFKNGELTITGHKANSASSDVQLRIELFKKVGSSVQLDRFVSNMSEGTSLPAQVKVYNSNDSWQRIGSRSQGDMNIAVGDEMNLTGDLFGSSFNANLMSF